MKIMSMVRRFRCRNSLFFSIVSYSILMLSALGCSAATQTSRQGCADYFEVLEGIVSNADVRKYGHVHFDSRNTVFLWERLPSRINGCKSANGAMTILRSSSPAFNRHEEFIFIERMYLEKDVAFVEFNLAPSGKNGDALLRKKPGGWAVVQSYFWEN